MTKWWRTTLTLEDKPDTGQQYFLTKNCRLGVASVHTRRVCGSRPVFTHKHTNLTVGERAEIDDKIAAHNPHLTEQARHWPHTEWQKIAASE